MNITTAMVEWSLPVLVPFLRGMNDGLVGKGVSHFRWIIHGAFNAQVMSDTFGRLCTCSLLRNPCTIEIPSVYKVLSLYFHRISLFTPVVPNDRERFVRTQHSQQLDPKYYRLSSRFLEEPTLTSMNPRILYPKNPPLTLVDG